MAAAVALPSLPPTAHAEPEIVHTAGCFHRVWARPDHDRADVNRLQEAFSARVDHETWLLHDAILVEGGHIYDRERERFLDSLERLLPGLAPIVRLVAYHVIEENYAHPGECCSPEPDPA